MASWTCCDRTLTPDARPLVMGILNVTPDSFSDGGRFADAGDAVECAFRMAEEGADIVDIGGESTRPGAAPVAVEDELRRVLPAVEALAGRCRAALSIDTRKAAVAKAALEAGAHIVNDVSALRHDPDMLPLVAATGAGVILMHMQGTPATMQTAPRYDHVVAEVAAFLNERMQAAAAGGVALEQMAVDPGIGFGKTLEHNLLLLRHLAVLSKLGRPVAVGLSRKRFLGALTGREVDERLAAGLAGLTAAVLHGASILRVHDVAASVDAARVAAAMAGAAEGGAA